MKIIIIIKEKIEINKKKNARKKEKNKEYYNNLN